MQLATFRAVGCNYSYLSGFTFDIVSLIMPCASDILLMQFPVSLAVSISKTTVMKKITTLAIIVICFSSCFNNYYKVKSNDQWNEDQMQVLQKSEKRLIVHFMNGTKEMSKPIFKAEQITGGLKEYFAVSDRYIDPDTTVKSNFKYKFRHRKVLFSEIHIYVNEDYSGQKEFRISKENFNSSYFNIPNRGLSIASHVLGITIIVGVLVGIGALAESVSLACYLCQA
jgi:hypothetical protein